MNQISVSQLNAAVTQASLLRIRLHLTPANDDGLVYPPTYDQGQHIFRPAWIDGVARDAVLLDSVQSQANRLEIAILQASRSKEIAYPDISISVNAETGHEQYSVLELSHRIYDAALRACWIDGVLFRNTAIGKAISDSRPERATALFEHAPIVLLLGGWDSHGGGGPLVAKLPRLITSEIIGLDAKAVQRGSVKFDPMDIRKSAGPIYDSANHDRLYEIDPKKAKDSDSKKIAGKKPSEVGLGSVPALGERGAVITEARLTSLLSLSGIRRLRFPTADNTYDEGRDVAGRVATAALGLYALSAQLDAGFNLRSGCDLIPVSPPVVEIIGRSMDDITLVEISKDTALHVLQEALQMATAKGLGWRKSEIQAVADERLTTLVERSRKAAAGGNE
jgi:CRISPR-associated protein Csb1